MGKFMGAVAAVLLVGCGMEQPEPVAPSLPVAETAQEQQPSRQIVVQQQQQEPRFKNEPTKVVELANPRQTVNVTVQLKNATTNVVRLGVVLGQMGCGFGTFAGGEAPVKDGVAEVKLNDIPANMEWVDMLVFQDTDGDGQCTAADSVWTASLKTTSFNSLVSFDLNELQKAEEWTCFAFNITP